MAMFLYDKSFPNQYRSLIDVISESSFIYPESNYDAISSLFTFKNLSFKMLSVFLLDIVTYILRGLLLLNYPELFETRVYFLTLLTDWGFDEIMKEFNMLER